MPDIQFTRPDGGTTRGHLAEPAGAVKGNVVVIQEYWGLNAQIRKTADRLAEAGFRALAPDLYKGKIASDATEATHEMRHLNWGEAVSQDLAGAVSFLRQKEAAARVATMGFCMGGALTILSAIQLPIDAAVCFYGIPPDAREGEAGDPAKIRVPMLFHFATHDDWCNAGAIARLEARMREGEVGYVLHKYDAAHAFMNEARPEVHAPKAAKLAWDRSLEFLGKNLG